MTFCYFCDGKRHHGAKKKDVNKLEHLENEELLPVHSGPARKGEKHMKTNSLTISKDDLLNMPHLHFSRGICTETCKKHEVCVKDNKTQKSVCVLKSFLKESRHLFKMYKKGKANKFHKKVKKFWKKHGDKKFQQLHKNKFNKKGWKNRHTNVHDKINRKGRKHPKVEVIELYGETKHNKKELNKKINEGLEIMNNIEDVNSLLHDSPPVENHSNKNHHHKSCHPDQLEEVRNRLAGLFAVMHQQEKEKHMSHGHKHPHHKKHKKHHHKCQCSRSVHWEFYKLDKDGDHSLTDKEMASLEHNRYEPCIKPLLHSCDRNQDSVLSRKEWCCCFSGIGPCSTKLMEIEEGGMKPVKEIPRCTPDGFFDKVQCDINGECWCSDLDGNEINGTRKNTRENGKPHCGEIDVFGHKKQSHLI